MAGNTVECDNCGNESECIWKCDECGKPFDGDESSGGDRAVIGGGR